ncbi:glycosyltransferase family 1 protein [Leptolyngbya sp. FACHB-261]|uniref:glycosyltransferase family 4 protein n=1 Tax=Leptolyngbya sp. FACHB-261 TaxID=2692806 RepID=UPI001688D0EA|nr:glycosyltransferase [Leptolyngbya sp. FACHB-261]MBD2103179.1 glycosyltransferase family 4 protein [Leptolyngbya sp. FACHB-261]
MTDSLLVNLSFLLAQPTGTSTYALNLLPWLRPLNPTLLSAQPLPTYNCYSVPANQTAEQGAKGHFLRLAWTQWQLPKIYRSLGSPLLFSPIPEAPIFLGCRYIVTVHDLIPIRFPNQRSPLTAYFRYYVPQLLAQAQHILCNSLATARDLNDFFQVSAQKITPILLAHDSQHFTDLKLPKQNYFLYIGRHNTYKNLGRLVSAFAAVQRQFETELWIAGPLDRRYTPELMAQIQELGVTNQVKFLEYVPSNELPKLLNQALALVFPSLWEGFGLPVLEAMACGTPVITSNLSSLPEVTGDAALLIDPYNVAELVDAMRAIASDATLRSRLRTAGLARASQFSWAKTGQATNEVLKLYL